MWPKADQAGEQRLGSILSIGVWSHPPPGLVRPMGTSSPPPATLPLLSQPPLASVDLPLWERAEGLDLASVGQHVLMPAQPTPKRLVLAYRALKIVLWNRFCAWGMDGYQASYKPREPLVKFMCDIVVREHLLLLRQWLIFLRGIGALCCFFTDLWTCPLGLAPSPALKRLSVQGTNSTGNSQDKTLKLLENTSVFLWPFCSHMYCKWAWDQYSFNTRYHIPAGE